MLHRQSAPEGNRQLLAHVGTGWDLAWHPSALGLAPAVAAPCPTCCRLSQCAHPALYTLARATALASTKKCGALASAYSNLWAGTHGA